MIKIKRNLIKILKINKDREKVVLLKGQEVTLPLLRGLEDKEEKLNLETAKVEISNLLFLEKTKF